MIDAKAQDFTLPATGGCAFRLSAQVGKVVVIYFYPKDSTPGCTTLAQSFKFEVFSFKFGASRLNT